MPASLLERCARGATRLPRAAKTWIVAATDAGAMVLALFLALTLKHESAAAALQASMWLYTAAAIVPPMGLASFGAYRAVFRFISPDVLFRSAVAVLAAGALLALFDASLLVRPVGVHSIAIFTALALLCIVGSRALAREWLYFRRGQKQRIAIYGAGVAGAQRP
jgi:FlaA1/EpsC-like NDP-sugar epimerase